MKQAKLFFLFLFLPLVFTACQNIPQNPTATPTYSEEELMQFAQQTAEIIAQQTETQYAIENPSPTPLPTDTPTPEPTATSAVLRLPPTATEAARNYYSMGEKSSRVYEVGNPSDYSARFVPQARLYIEICYQNAGSGTWTPNFYAQVTNQSGAGVDPATVYLGKSVGTDEWACFSFNSYNAEQSLGTHCPSFWLYNEQGQQVVNGDHSVCWTIY